jgi:hypothetical protein
MGLQAAMEEQGEAFRQMVECVTAVRLAKWVADGVHY